MDGPLLILLELGLIVAILGWAIYEVISLRRDKRQREQRQPGKPPNTDKP